MTTSHAVSLLLMIQPSSDRGCGKLSGPQKGDLVRVLYIVP